MVRKSKNNNNNDSMMNAIFDFTLDKNKVLWVWEFLLLFGRNLYTMQFWNKDSMKFERVLQI